MICDVKSVFCLVFQALQHGPGECEGDVDGGSKEWEGQEEVQASQQGSLHLQDVPAGRLCHHRAEKSSDHREMNSGASGVDPVSCLSCFVCQLLVTLGRYSLVLVGSR